jgi:tetratricopeptide (TPR) repeat protein
MRAFVLGFSIVLATVGEVGASSRREALRACETSESNPDIGIIACSYFVNSRSRGLRESAYNNRCVAYNAKGEFDRAIPDCDESIRINSQNWHAYSNRCWSYYNKGNQEAAIADCDEAIRLNPQNAISYHHRGLSYGAKGAHDAAIADFNQAILLAPRWVNGYTGRGDIYQKKGAHDRAIADFDQAIQLSPQDPSAYLSRGNAFVAKGEYDRAISDYDQAIRIAPKLAGAYTARGDALSAKGLHERAIADFSRAINIDPQNVQAYVNRGVTYWRNGDNDRALSDYDQAGRLDPKLSSPYNNRCAVYNSKGEYGRAIAECDRAAELDPNLPNARNHRGWAYFQKGDNDRAISDLNAAVRLGPKYISARERRGHVLFALGNVNAALDDYNEALRLNADTIGALWGRGQCYERQGLRALALPDYKKAIELRAVNPEEAEAQTKARGRLVALESGPQLQAAAPPQSPQKEQPQTSPKRAEAMGRRVALVIGNGAYKAVATLPNPSRDAAAVAAQLRRLGFEVLERHNLGADGMRTVLGDFEDKATGADWAFVYYAGHGMELNGRNWLIPVDAKLERATDAADEAVPLDRVLARLEAAKKLRIVVLDACRNNPFLARMVMSKGAERAVSRGLSKVEPSHGEVVFYAARDGNVALDGSGSNSPFAAALLKHLDEDGVELGRFFRKVAASVMDVTGNKQEPFVYGHIPDEDYYFKPARQP